MAYESRRGGDADARSWPRRARRCRSARRSRGSGMRMRVRTPQPRPDAGPRRPQAATHLPRPTPLGASATRRRATPAARPPKQSCRLGDGDERRRRLRRSRGGWLRRAALDLAQLEGSGPGGRIVKADVERAHRPRVAWRRGGRGRTPWPARRPPRRPRQDAAVRDRQGAGQLRGPLEAAVHRRPADGRVEGDGAALLPGGRDRHDRAVEARAG